MEAGQVGETHKTSLPYGVHMNGMNPESNIEQVRLPRVQLRAVHPVWNEEINILISSVNKLSHSMCD